MNEVPVEKRIEEIIKEEKKIEEMIEEEKKILRWGQAERFEHHTLILLTFAFIISGLPILKIEWFSWMVISPTTVDVFRIIHRFAAGLFVILAIFHVSYHSLALRKTRIVVNLKDIRDSISLLKYYMGLTDDKPKLGFHNPTEKILVYWFMAVWFMIFMGGSGFILMFPSYFSAWVHEWALVIHDVFFYLIVIVLVAHFYMTVLYKDYRPLLEGIFTTGLISTKFVKEHHPEWYEEVKKGKEESL
jgi:formate dehydrogenase subunit gamma